jgi:hypothetical protein
VETRAPQPGFPRHTQRCSPCVGGHVYGQTFAKQAQAWSGAKLNLYHHVTAKVRALTEGWVGAAEHSPMLNRDGLATESSLGSPWQANKTQ